ncbi:tropomyosin [Holotrichia oblita]|uniref:Tropomyosin n=1 Tax=Holotrichia oblita TaxID=644536 RepID=A0ACB9SWN6_HOLOL|nr:tropomyosin [Holotrichia oblita]
MYTLLHNVARKLVIMEIDLERAEERAVQSDRKIVELEEELRVVGNNLKSLEVSEEKATLREEEYTTTLKSLDNQLKEAAATRDSCEDKIHVISDKLREAEARAEFAERSVQKLQKEVDRLEDDLLVEKERNKQLADEMEATLHDIQNM